MSRQSEEEIEALVEEYQRAEVQSDRNRPRGDVLFEFKQFQRVADADDSYTLRCVICKKKVTGPRYREALGEGHVYSDEGRREFSLSKMCEFCFDKITAEPEEENPHILMTGPPTTGKRLGQAVRQALEKYLGEEL